jgi:hypothetical protein
MAVALTLFFVSPAAAEKTEMYAAFTKCPTESPEMNNPENIGAACMSAIVHSGFFRLGNVGASLTSPLHMQAALVGKESGLEVLPGSTVLEGAPATLPNPFIVPPSGGGESSPPPSTGTPPPSTETPPPPPIKHHKKKHHKKHHKRKHHRRHHRRHKKGSGHGGKGKGAGRHQEGWSSVTKLMSMAASNRTHSVAATAATGSQQSVAGSEELIEVYVEPAGDLRNLNFGAFVEEPGIAFELPVKVHLVGTGLGSQCYIGSNAEPIVIAPERTAVFSSLGFGLDPNGFEVRVVGVGGESFEDATFTVPAASGCGEVPGGLDAAVNSLVGLPAASGHSQLAFEDVLLELVGAESVGTTGGKELQEAFEAAKE